MLQKAWSAQSWFRLWPWRCGFPFRLRPRYRHPCCPSKRSMSAAKLSACAGGIPARANIAWIGVESQGIRYRDDGTAPTASVGFPIPAGGTLFYVGTLSAIELIGQNAAAIV